MLHLMAYHRDVPQQHEGGKEESGYQSPPEQYLDALRQKFLHNTIHHLRNVDRPGTQPHAVDITRTTGKSVSNVILHATSVQRRADESANDTCSTLNTDNAWKKCSNDMMACRHHIKEMHRTA